MRAIITHTGFRAAASLVLLPVLLMPATATAGELTSWESRDGLAHLDKTREALLEATKGLSEAQWRFKPAPEQWSVAETLEHIVLTEDMLLGLVANKVMAAPAGRPDRELQAIDKLVLGAIADRSHKVKAPEVLAPTARWSVQESRDRFIQARAKTVAFLKSTSGLRDHVMDSPLGQPLDAYQWLLYISAHSERHTKQILEVKADPGFPRQ